MNDMEMTGCTSEPRKEPTIAEYSTKLHITLVEARSAMGYIMRNVLGTEIPDLSPDKADCYFGSLKYDVAMAHEIMLMTRELAERIGGNE